MSDPVEYETLTYSVADHVAEIRFTRPDGANAVNVQMSKDLRAATLAAHYDPDVRVLLVTAEGKVFCAGGDLVEFHAAGDDLPSVAADMLTDRTFPPFIFQLVDTSEAMFLRSRPSNQAMVPCLPPMPRSRMKVTGISRSS